MRAAAPVLAAALVATPAAAEFPGAAHVAELEGCLEAADYPENCKGIISGPCMKAQAEGRDAAACLAGERAAWYEVIRDVYADLEARAPDRAHVERLRAAQGAWVEHRNADCVMRAALADDPHRHAAACTMKHTAARAIALMALRGQ